MTEEPRRPADETNERWRTLPVYLVRLAGFSFDRLDGLRCSRAASAARALEAADAARRAAGHAFDDALGRERFSQYPAFDDAAVRKAFTRDYKQARDFAKQLSAAPAPGDALREIVRVVPALGALTAELVERHRAWCDAQRAFDAAFADEFEQARGALRRLFGDPRLCEAVFLQSLDAFEAVQQMVAATGPRNTRMRQRERLAAMYAQRFCAKNDTNSFCGPIGIGDAAREATRDGARPTASVIDIAVEDARRRTYFSHWAAQRLLAEAVRRADDASLTTLRLHPTARIDGGAVSWCAMDHDATMTFRRRYARSELPPGALPLVQAMATPRTLDELVSLGGQLELDAEDTHAFVEQLIESGLVLRGPVLPPGLFYPLRAAAAEIEGWPTSDTRAWALGEIEAAEQLIAAFAQAPLRERVAIQRTLAARFEQATGSPASRGEGRHYADRSVLQEDCYVEVRCDLGDARGALERALPPLMSAVELPLELARERVREWFRARFGAGVRVPAVEVHRAFDGDRVLDAPAATPRAGSLAAAIERVRAVIERAAGSSSGGQVRIDADDLCGALAGLAMPAHAGYVSADVMLRRLPSGGAGLVLGEVHGFVWMPTNRLDIVPPDQRERVLDHMRAAVQDMACGKRTAEAVFLHTQATDRRFPLATTDLQLVVRTDRPGALDFGAVDVRLTGDDFEFLHGDEEIVPLVAYTRYPFLLYTSRVAPLYDDFAETFFPESLLPAALREDAPRLALDDLVVRRRQWRRPAAQVHERLSGSEAELFRRAQSLQRELGCGARVFASLRGQPKPVMIDFENVFLLEALRNMLESQPDGAVVKLTEMLPAPGELVATGPDGPRTSELRMGFYRLAAPGSPGARQGSGSTAAIRSSAV